MQIYLLTNTKQINKEYIYNKEKIENIYTKKIYINVLIHGEIYIQKRYTNKKKGLYKV